VTTAAALAGRVEQAKAQAAAQGRKPNIVVIWGDDIGQSDISAFTMGLMGMMGFRTPNIDRIAKEGVICTHPVYQRPQTGLVNPRSGLARRRRTPM
jgi:hypothetical protein